VRRFGAKADASLIQLPNLQLPSEPEVHIGGHGLYASIDEYMKFIRMWLNDGAGPHGRVLKKVEAAVRNGLEARQAVVMLPGVIATLSNDAEFKRQHKAGGRCCLQGKQIEGES
jgi:methyl acetate hydrolase